MTVTYLPATQDVHDEATRQNFEWIENWALFKSSPAPSVTGSRGGNVALASLLTVLDSQGLITNNTTV